MRELLSVFQEVEDPRRGNAKRHDLHDMLAISLLSMLTADARAWTWRTKVRGGVVAGDVSGAGAPQLAGLSAVGKVVAERRLADGAESVDTRYCLLSAKLSAERFGRTVAPTGPSRTPMLRIGRLHWVLDVSMDEDQARNRKGNGAASLAVVRRLALNMARMHLDKRSVRRKFIHAQRSDDFLLDMIRGVRGHEEAPDFKCNRLAEALDSP